MTSLKGTKIELEAATAEAATASRALKLSRY